MLLLVLLTTLVVLSGSFLLWLWWNLYHYVPVALRPSHARGPLKVCAVLGSGGHTSELLRLIRALPASYWGGNRPFYVVSASDTHSASVAQEQELRLYGRNAVFHVIPRAREVGQSYSSSVSTTLKAIAKSFRVIRVEKPDVLLTNGPGVCIPVIVASLVLAAALPWRFRRPAILYCESFTCVRHVSLTGMIVAPFLADVLTVYWRPLLPVVRALRQRAVELNSNCGCFYVGPPEGDFNGADSKGEDAPVSTAERSASLTSGLGASHQREGSHKSKFALVTVGSTRFDKLVNAMATESACRALREAFGVTHLLLQYGASDFTLPAGATAHQADLAGRDPAECSELRAAESPPPSSSEVQQCVCAGVTIEAFRYRSGLSRWVRHAHLVITHAGAGTILECLQARVPAIVVPNRDLMSDHQLELAEALAAEQHLFYMSPSEIAEKLKTLDIGKLRPYHGIDKSALRRVMSLPFTGNLVDTE